MKRRSALKIMLAAACSSIAAETTAGQDARTDSRPAAGPATRPGAGRIPPIFLAHGSPHLLDDAGWSAELAAWAKRLPRPKSILMISAHWEQKPLTLGATKTVPLVYDFYGFPEKHYKVKYPAPGAPGLARRVRELVGKQQPLANDPERGLDHGAYVPLVAMYPEADVPVLQISLPTMRTPDLFQLGRALAPLRDEGTLIVGSGFLTHNLSSRSRRGDGPPAWSKEFDAWTADVLTRRAHDQLMDYRYVAPGVKEALPTHEHFVPVVVAQGAAADDRAPVTFPIAGFTGVNTRRSVQFG